jgi:hypothetical protein
MTDPLTRAPQVHVAGQAVDAAITANAYTLRQLVAAGATEQAAVAALAKRFMAEPGASSPRLIVGLARMLAHALARLNRQADRIEQLHARIEDLKVLAAAGQDGDR